MCHLVSGILLYLRRALLDHTACGEDLNFLHRCLNEAKTDLSDLIGRLRHSGSGRVQQP
jgi:hypothetical protein